MDLNNTHLGGAEVETSVWVQSMAAVVAKVRRALSTVEWRKLSASPRVFVGSRHREVYIVDKSRCWHVRLDDPVNATGSGRLFIHQASWLPHLSRRPKPLSSVMLFNRLSLDNQSCTLGGKTPVKWWSERLRELYESSHLSLCNNNNKKGSKYDYSAKMWSDSKTVGELKNRSKHRWSNLFNTSLLSSAQCVCTLAKSLRGCLLT